MCMSRGNRYINTNQAESESESVKSIRRELKHKA
jgi:hypothetical protein